MRALWMYYRKPFNFFGIIQSHKTLVVLLPFNQLVSKKHSASLPFWWLSTWIEKIVTRRCFLTINAPVPSHGLVTLHSLYLVFVRLIQNPLDSRTSLHFFILVNYFCSVNKQFTSQKFFFHMPSKLISNQYRSLMYSFAGWLV